MLELENPIHDGMRLAEYAELAQGQLWEGVSGQDLCPDELGLLILKQDWRSGLHPWECRSHLTCDAYAENPHGPDHCLLRRHHHQIHFQKTAGRCFR